MSASTSRGFNGEKTSHLAKGSMDNLNVSDEIKNHWNFIWLTLRLTLIELADDFY